MLLLNCQAASRLKKFILLARFQGTILVTGRKSYSLREILSYKQVIYDISVSVVLVQSEHKPLKFDINRAIRANKL